MSENRFADCEAVRSVLWRFHDEVSKPNCRGITDEALARIHELTPPPTVSEEARERAEIRLGHWLRERGVSTSGIGDVLDRIIDALGYQPAEPKPVAVSEEARERAREVLRDLVNDEMVSPGCSLHYAIDRVIDALGYTPAPGENCYKCGDHQYGVEPVCKRCQMVMLTATPVSPPVVELDAESVRLLIERVGDLIEPGERMTFKRDDETVTLYRGNAGLVLRIGGTDE